MKKTNESPIYRTSSNVHIRAEDNYGALLYNPENNWAKVINSTGLNIWKNCENGMSLPFILKGIHEHFEIPLGADLEKEVLSFLDSMINANFMSQCNV
jgi:hypothetical protein